MVLVLGHRGASATRPENTIDAFAEARRLGADGVELDVRRTADDGLAVHHDAVLADGRRLVDLRVQELPPSVPLLRDALDACDGLLVNVEIKNAPQDPDFDPDHAIAGWVADSFSSRDRILVSCFNLATLDAVRLVDPEIRTGWLTVPAWDQAAAVARAADGGHTAFHPHESVVTAELVDRAHRAGLEVNTWTVDDPARMAALATLGVDAVITNLVDVAVRTLRPRD
jgi:glycerophosphoryl diester phosphodiesterase